MNGFSIIPLLLLAALDGSNEAPKPGVAVTFQINDALVKDKVLPGVGIGIARPTGEGQAAPSWLVTGKTDASGRFATRLEPGKYLVTYRLRGYVPIVQSPTEIRAGGQLITTTLSLMLEAEGRTVRRIRIILNWGSDSSQVKDADSHFAPAGSSPGIEVYFSEKRYQGEGGHSVELDVDDVDWGGPETITVIEPPSGTYHYWVHDYSGPPAVLGKSEVVVRVLIDDRVAGEYRVPTSVESRVWRPFKALVVTDLLDARIDQFDDQELVASAHLARPPGEWSDVGEVGCEGCNCAAGVLVFILVVVWIGAGFRKRARR